MATNVEKFVVDLGFNDADLKRLKELLKLQQTADKNAPKRLQQTTKQVNEERKLNTLANKRLQMKKLIAKAEKEGVAVTKYKKSLSAAKKIETLEKRRIELEELFWKAKEANQKKAQAAKQKELNTEKKITQEKVKQTSPSFSDRRNEVRMRNAFVEKVGLRVEKSGGSQGDIDAFKKKAKAAYGYKASVAELNNELNRYAHKQRQATMRTRKANLAMQGLNDSTRHMVRSYASLYAVFEATTAINRTGQQFEAMNSAMLAATGTSEMAANEVAFLDKMTSRLGLSLLDTSDAYTKFLFASKGKLDQDQTRELFTGLSELGTTLGVSKERMKLSMNAITQMMNKGKISSEELRLQLAESLPGAIQIFARSINKSEAELFKMMENGELLAADVLPKVAKEMKKVAAVGLEDKLDTLRVAQGQFFNELQKAQDTIFQSGFAEGLKDMFFTISEFLKGNEDSLEGFGKGFKMVFNLMDGALKLILPILGAIGRALGTVHDSLTAIFGEDLFIDAGTQVSGLGLAFTALAVKMSPVYRMALAIIGVMDEIAALFSTGRLGILEVALGKDIDISKADLDLFDIVTATSNPMKLMELNEKMNGSSGVFTDVNRSRINNSLELKVTTDKESTVEVVKKELSKEYDVNILSGAF